MKTFIGKCSVFGGYNDDGMTDAEGLTLYEPAEADRRPDLFHGETRWPYDNGKAPKCPTWKRLKTDSFYIAMRFEEFIDESRVSRKVIQQIPFLIRNPTNHVFCVGFLVDRGPGIKDRLVDVSPGIAKYLILETDDEVEVTMLDMPPHL